MNKNLHKTIINRNTSLIAVVVKNKMAVFSISGSVNIENTATASENHLSGSVKDDLIAQAHLEDEEQQRKADEEERRLAQHKAEEQKAAQEE